MAMNWKELRSPTALVALIGVLVTTLFWINNVRRDADTALLTAKTALERTDGIDVIENKIDSQAKEINEIQTGITNIVARMDRFFERKFGEFNANPVPASPVAVRAE